MPLSRRKRNNTRSHPDIVGRYRGETIHGKYLAERVDKPWGYELIWAKTSKYVGKILHINRGECLSLQYHRSKDESIMILSGRMKLQIGGRTRLEDVDMKPGDCRRIAPGRVHRMISVEDCDVIEVSTPHLKDVVRLEDRYGRTIKK